MDKKTSYTMEELDAKIQDYIARGLVKKTPQPTKKQREAAQAFTEAVEANSPEVRDFYNEDPTGNHFARSHPLGMEFRKRYMKYVHAKRILR